ncbi:15-hydroxyprostaglandin dehydrogenase [NAD(+)]-like [Xylocopa sonorina]|uniref:15-hydroxyprostaglandin dehydrogenase [NAD(+)]-like n=1 Tax=Xylocopa sonorina TaxID=1818115 RepID=UPI00403AC8E2
MNVKDKVIVITGGASGIGLSCSEKLLLRDAKFVAIFDVPSPSVEATVNKLKKQFGDNRTGLYACDVTKNEQVESSFGKVIDLFGSFDVLINSAGIFSQVNWQHMIDVNFTGLVRTTLKAIDLIGKHKGGKGGTILNVASTLGFKPWEYMPIYSGTKSGVIGITLGLKHFYPITGVRMLLVCPGFTDTSFSPKLFSATYFDFIDAEKLKENTKGKICQPWVF